MMKKTEKEIYYLYSDEMYAVCYRYTGNAEISEELVNNGFIKVFKNLSKFKVQDKNSFKYWIKKIMANECLMYLRKKKKLRVLCLDEVSEFEISSQNNALNITSNQIDRNEIEELILRLPLGYRSIFNLYAIDGYSHKEISKMLRIKESTSRSQLTMARKYLKEMLIKKGFTS